MENFIGNIFQFFDLGLMISIILITYGIFELLKMFKVDWNTNIKRLITIVISAILSVVYHYVIGVSLTQIIPTYLISVVLYDYIIKILLKKLKVSEETT